MNLVMVSSSLAVLSLLVSPAARSQAPVDVHGAGYTTAADLLEFSGNWQDETDFSKFDWNADRRLEAGDLLEILRSWSSRNDVLAVEIPNLPASARPLRLVRIPAGSFQMGSALTERNRQTSEGPRHEVGIAGDFYMAETEVTQAQWQAVMGTNPSVGWGVGPDYPVYSVAWVDITKPDGFLGRLRTATGLAGFRLPSEAEWEYACRGGTETRFFFGDSADFVCDDACEDCEVEVLDGWLTDYFWYCGNNGQNGYPSGSKPVARLAANQFGLFDTHGNVAEWIQDYWHNNYVGAPTDGRAWESTASIYRVFRGGNWSQNAKDCRSASRDRDLPTQGQITVGLRVVLPVP